MELIDGHRPGADGPGPLVLTAVRHGQSTGNAAFEAAEAVGALDAGVTARDADLSLTALGRAQSAALGRRLGERAESGLPQSLWVSPYLRTRETAEIILEQLDRAALPLPRQRVDERLRDRELGILDMLTTAAIEHHHPAEAARRRRLGEFYYRPPGGESLADVALRLRSALRDLFAAEDGRRVLVVAHDSVVLMLHHLLDGLAEQEVPGPEQPGHIANASLTRWLRTPSGGFRLDCYNRTEHLTELPEPSA
jgi:probable phosphoglycerate mutase